MLKKLNFALVKKPLTVFLKADLQTAGLKRVSGRGEQRRARDDGHISSSEQKNAWGGNTYRTGDGGAVWETVVIVAIAIQKRAPTSSPTKPSPSPARNPACVGAPAHVFSMFLLGQVARRR